MPAEEKMFNILNTKLRRVDIVTTYLVKNRRTHLSKQKIFKEDKIPNIYFQKMYLLANLRTIFLGPYISTSAEWRMVIMIRNRGDMV